MFASTRPIVWSLEVWPVAALLQAIRHSIDDQKVAGLVASLREGRKLPEILVLVDGTRVTILDGHHRVAAWAIAGIEAVGVLVARPK